MDNLFDDILKVVPELKEDYFERIRVLQRILKDGPIGRKGLAENLAMTERPLRTITDILKRQGLIDSSPAGMTITSQGERAIATGQDLWRDISKIHLHEKALADVLNIADARIVSGDIDLDKNILFEMGLQVSKYLDNKLSDGNHTIAITGGSTMLAVSEHIQLNHSANRHFTVVAARGGIGDASATQANTISDILAQRLHGHNISLYAPENLSEVANKALMNDPVIQSTLSRLKEANVLLFSVGSAKIMARRRGLDSKSNSKIKTDHAVGEAFGCFFDKDGNIVHRVPRIGLQLEDLADVDLPILIAGGNMKAEAIQAFAKLAPKQLVIITDQGASNTVLNGESH
ncbi:hypothetical protein EF384_00850 [Aerococcus agrisoli]|uniref:Uncharacterized protein n=1 Tax=Aerococcus agrisoli TaxID=2487350 RepID=A0A3N4HEX4_9LACT|nr:sugar-binding domain-containing protein [Aerococcus agrisoli]RPA64994.1 hypothetical protein EF384_00850 [Aerococcus agrisoli]